MFSVLVECPQEQVPDISDALQALDALAVSVEDADAQSPAEVALFDEPGQQDRAQGWVRSRISALFALEVEARDAAKLLVLQNFFQSSTLLGIQEIADQDWVRLTQSQFENVRILDDFWVVPSWHTPPAVARKVIRLDPGLAFGTGTHPTTCMCLRWIAQRDKALGRTLDYGCGSGILSIAACLYGATSVTAVDIDPSALDSCRQNALANGVSSSIEVGSPDLSQGLYDVVMANILAQPLKVLAPLLCAHVGPGGALVLAGILERQCKEIQTAYQPYLKLSQESELDGWVMMTARRD